MDDLLPSARLITCGLFEVVRAEFFVLDELGLMLVLTGVLLGIAAGLATLVLLFVAVIVVAVELVLVGAAATALDAAAAAAALDAAAAAAALDAAAAAACCCAWVCAASTGVVKFNNNNINTEVDNDCTLVFILISSRTQCKLGTSKFPLNRCNNISVFACTVRASINSYSASRNLSNP